MSCTDIVVEGIFVSTEICQVFWQFHIFSEITQEYHCQFVETAIVLDFSASQLYEVSSRRLNEVIHHIGHISFERLKSILQIKLKFIFKIFVDFS